MIALKVAVKELENKEVVVNAVLPSEGHTSYSFEFGQFLLVSKVISKRNTLKVGRRGNRNQTDFLLYNTDFQAQMGLPSGVEWEDIPASLSVSIMGHHFGAFPSGNKGVQVFTIFNRMNYALIVMVNPAEYHTSTLRPFQFKLKNDYGEKRIIERNVKKLVLPKMYETLLASILESDKEDIKQEKEKENVESTDDN